MYLKVFVSSCRHGKTYAVQRRSEGPRAFSQSHSTAGLATPVNSELIVCSVHRARVQRIRRRHEQGNLHPNEVGPLETI